MSLGVGAGVPWGRLSFAGDGLASPVVGTTPGGSLRIALLTAGGLAPCLSSAVGGLIDAYSSAAPDAEILAYRDGYAGLLTGDSFVVSAAGRAQAHFLHGLGGSPIGNSTSNVGQLMLSLPGSTWEGK